MTPLLMFSSEFSVFCLLEVSGQLLLIDTQRFLLQGKRFIINLSNSQISSSYQNMLEHFLSVKFYFLQAFKLDSDQSKFDLCHTMKHFLRFNAIKLAASV